MLLAQKQQEKTLTNCTDSVQENRSLDPQENSQDVSSLNSHENSQNVSSLNTPIIATELSSMNSASPVNGGMNIHDSFSAAVAQHTHEVMHIDVLSQSSPLAINEMNQIIEHITNVHLSQTPLTLDFVASLPEREKRYFVSVCPLLPLNNNSNTVLRPVYGSSGGMVDVGTG